MPAKRNVEDEEEPVLQEIKEIKDIPFNEFKQKMITKEKTDSHLKPTKRNATALATAASATAMGL